MGMTTHIVGFVPPDDKYRQMVAVWEACRAAKVSPPDEVTAFFEDANDGAPHPDPAGFTMPVPIHEWRDDMAGEGFEVHVDEIPPQVKTIRFYNSW